MTLSELDGRKVREILTSHSIDNVFDFCERKFEFLNLHDKRPPRESGFAAMVGDAIHDGVQQWLIARAEGKNETEATDIAFWSLAKRYPFEVEYDQGTNARCFGNTCLLLYEMIRDPEWDQWELMWVEGRGWAVEVPFVIRHTSIGIFEIKSRNELGLLVTQGKIDLILRHKHTRRVKTRDIKSTILDASLVRSEYTYSGQQIGYSHVAHAMLGLAPADFDVDYYIGRFSASGLPEVQTVPMHKSADDIDDYWLAKLSRLWRMKIAAENDHFHRANGSCHSWGHECQMFDICGSRDPKLIKRWFEDIDSEPHRAYVPWVELEV